MPSFQIGNVKIQVETRGPEKAPAFLLIRGLSTQLIHWPESFLDALVDAGFRVVVFDNRDCGLSQKFEAAGTPALDDLLRGEIDPPYRVADMALDAVGVLDALGIERAHAAGISLGGMIAQHLAFSHGSRFETVASIMSTSGAPGLPAATPEAMEALTSTPSDPTDREIVIAHSMRTQRVIESPKYPPTEAESRSYFERGFDRCYCPDGSARQMAAVVADGSRAERLEAIDLPFLVLHGLDDPLIPVACGEDTARRVPRARFETIRGMGHDITQANSSLVVKQLIEHAQQNAVKR
jgi:pimeloyl-ACP methyl ester carboxylesterase